MWLRDFLPKEIPKARILSYGYDTKLPGSQSTASMLELSRKLLESVKTVRNKEVSLRELLHLDRGADFKQNDRPIIFIGHGLGGIVVKQVCSILLRQSLLSILSVKIFLHPR